MNRSPASPLREHFLRKLAGSKWRALAIVVCLLAATAAELAAPWPFKLVVDNVLLEHSLPPALGGFSRICSEEKSLAIVVLALAILGLALVKAGAGYLQQVLTSSIGYEIAYSLRDTLFRRLLDLPITFHRRARAGELLSKVSDDTKALKAVFSGNVIDFPAHVVLLLSMCGVMLAMSWQLALIVLGTFPVLSWILYRRFKILRSSSARERKKEGEIASRITERLAALDLLQVHACEDVETAAFENENALAHREALRAARAEAAAARAVDTVTAAGQCLVVLFGAFHVVAGRLSPGDLIVFTSYVHRLYKPVDALVKLLSKLTKASVSAQRVNELLRTESVPPDPPGAIAADGLRGEIRFQDVTFAYPGCSPALRGLSFHIKPGQKVALVGASGSGKSTIAGLVARLLDPQSGTVEIDGVDSWRYQRKSLRNQISLVLQDSILLGSTIRENIAYGRPEASLESVQDAARASHAHDLIEELDQGYDALVGERGATLSGGQRQRLALARAILRDAPILILDEPLRGLDELSESRVRLALKRVMRGRTSLLITHDLDDALEVDLVLVLEDGRIVEQGAPRELLSRKSLLSQRLALRSRRRQAPGATPVRTISPSSP